MVQEPGRLEGAEQGRKTGKRRQIRKRTWKRNTEEGEREMKITAGVVPREEAAERKAAQKYPPHCAGKMGLSLTAQRCSAGLCAGAVTRPQGHTWLENSKNSPV